jgi:ribosomal protein S6
MENDKNTIYEVGFHVATTLSEEKLPSEVTKIKDVLEKSGVEFISEEFPKRMQLAYTIEKKTQDGTIKHDSAYFGWVKFAVDNAKIAEIKEELDSNENIVRFIIVKTVRENTMPVKTFAPKKTEDAPEEKKEITEAEVVKIDESIDELVTKDAASKEEEK